MSSQRRADHSTHCGALDASGKACNVVTKNGAIWCPRHDEERSKLYVNYKAHHASLDAFPEHTICHNAESIVSCTSLEVIRGWNKNLLTKYQLLNRCIGARAYFTERFFGSDMDFGHKTFWENLLKQRAELEVLLTEMERRAYKLILKAQNALWVLDQHPQDADLSGDDCKGHTESDDPINMPTRVFTNDCVEIEDPLDAALREKCAELWDKIRTRLARYCTPKRSKFYDERIKVICACVRRAIYTNPSLMFLSQSYKNVYSLLKDSSLEVTTVERLWNAIKNLTIFDIRAAVDDVLRPKSATDTGDFVSVLGGKVYKDLGCSTLPFHAWGHISSVYICYSCIRRVCKTVDDVVGLTRFVVLTGSSLSQTRLKYSFDIDKTKTLSLCGFVPNVVDPNYSRYTVDKCNGASKKSTAHWREMKTNFVMCAGLSLNDPKSQKFLNACLRHPDFQLLIRKGKDGRVIRSAQSIWATRIRHASTRAGLKKVPWDSVADITYFKDSLLIESQPIISSTQRIEDCFQVAIIDSGEGDLTDFARKLGEKWFEAYGVKDINGLLNLMAGPYIDSGELELLSPETADWYLVPNVEVDILKSYRLLWGMPPRQGELPNDDHPVTLAELQWRYYQPSDSRKAAAATAA